MKELLRKRVIILSGKGGVGKTTVSVLLALMAAEQKKKVLLVEMNSTERVAPFFGLDAVGYQEIPLAPFITGINLNPKDCFEEYVVGRIHSKRIFDTFINNRFVTFFLNAIPGLNELLMLGKIGELERLRTRFSRQKIYDILIIDAPSTGHGVSTFEVPSIVLKAVHVGPLKHQASRILEFLQDEKTVFSVVTLSEEMPIVETQELIGHLRDRLGIALGPIFVNRLHSSVLRLEEIKKIESQMDKDDPAYPYYAYSCLDYERAELNTHYLDLLKKNHPDMELVCIPYLEEENMLTALKNLAGELQ